MRQIWSLIPVMALLASQASADNSASIRGVVRDAQGSPIGGASVLLVPPVADRAYSAPDGSFLMKPLGPGRYTVLVMHQGYSPWAVDGLELKELEVATLKVSLQATTEAALVYYESPTAKDLQAYSDLLPKLGEEVLCSPKMLSAATESYRFLWLRTFHHPVVVHLRLPAEGDASLAYKEADGAGGYKIGGLVHNEKISVTAKLRKDFGDSGDSKDVAAYLELFREVAAKNFWALPYYIDEPGMTGLDGATWTIEGIKNGKCHVVTRWSPKRQDPLRGFAEMLIELSGKRFYYDEVY